MQRNIKLVAVWSQTNLLKEGRNFNEVQHGSKWGTLSWTEKHIKEFAVERLLTFFKKLACHKLVIHNVMNTLTNLF